MTTITKKPTRRETNMKFFMDRLLAEKEVYGSLTIITYEPDSVAIFKGSRQVRPLWNCRFKSTDALNQFLCERKLSEDKSREIERLRLIEWEVERKKIVPGAILYSSWGYDQTNIDFYQVISRKKDFVMVQAIGSKRTYDDMDRGDCIADPDNKCGEPFRKKVNKYGSITISSFQSASLWNGKALGWSSYH